MILLLSINRDLSTDDIIDWLIKYNIPFYRLNDEDLLTRTKIKFFHNEENPKAVEFELVDEAGL